MHVHLVVLASCTARNVLAGKGGKAWPPKLRCDELVGFENTGVTCCGMVMVSRDNGAAEVGVGRDVNVILKGQDASIVLPIGEVGVEFGGEFSGECVESIKDEGVGCGGDGEPFGEGGVTFSQFFPCTPGLLSQVTHLCLLFALSSCFSLIHRLSH